MKQLIPITIAITGTVISSHMWPEMPMWLRLLGGFCAGLGCSVAYAMGKRDGGKI